jgi:hypothetical protein
MECPIYKILGMGGYDQTSCNLGHLPFLPLVSVDRLAIEVAGNIVGTPLGIHSNNHLSDDFGLLGILNQSSRFANPRDVEVPNHQDLIDWQ